MMKFFLILLFSVSTFLHADMFKDLEISNALLAASGYGTKQTWSTNELEKVEDLISKFSDPDLKKMWYSNLVTYALTSNGIGKQPPSAHCKIAKTNIPKIKDKDLIQLWNMNYSLYGCR